VIVQLTPFAPLVQSGLVAIVIDTGTGAGLGVAPLTVYTEIVIVAVLGEMNAGLRTFEDALLLLGIRTRTVAPVALEAVEPLAGRGLEPPPPPPHEVIRAANAAMAAPNSKR
jgi:hypothetical protein